MSAPKLLDLFSCAGGAAMGYHRAGFDVYCVDIAPQPNNPFRFHHGDALNVMRLLLRGQAVTFTAPDGSLEWLTLRDFAAVHASPPCQTFTAYKRRGAGVGESYVNLIPETRSFALSTGLPYVIENVEGARAELVNPFMLCGSSFGLDVRRHRLFETNAQIIAPPCDHSWQTPRFTPASNRKNLRRTVEVGVWRIPLDVQQRAMGIGWMKLRELSEAIPPAMTRLIGEQLLEHMAVSS